ncbi:MAG: hypothetical protein SVR04_16330 [Spirochaetota bacterium]|nr:hypothetical protein [Spirochaetota bacterium]
MNKIILITQNSEVKKAFSSIAKSRSFSFETVTHRAGEKCGSEAFRYIDVSGVSPKELEARLAVLSETGHPWGVVDPEGCIEDVGDLFHRGACDYIHLRSGKKLKVRRVQQAIDFHTVRSAPLVHGKGRTNTPARKASRSAAEYAREWSSVKSGRTYTFCIMYIELLPSPDVSGKSGSTYREQMQTAFHNMITQQVDPYDGRVWMWNEWGGLVLFPFDGSKCDTIIMAMRLILNRVPFSIECGPFNTILDFRLALHIGVTSYQDRGQTGTIISDDINFIFHLGKNKLEPGYLYLTDSFFPLLTDDLKKLFKEHGHYEEHRIYRMSSPYGIRI